MRKGVKGCLAALAASTALAAMAAFPAYAGQWQQDANGWWWQNDDGTYPEWMWAWIDGDHDGIAENYYFDENGYLAMDTSDQGMQVNQNGALVENGVVCTAQLPDGRDWYPGMAINGKLARIEVDMTQIREAEAAAAKEREEREKSWQDSVITADEVDPYEVAYMIVDLVNEERERKGKDPLAVNEVLMDNAMIRAEEAMEASRNDGHTRPDGSSCFTAIEIDYANAGENVAWTGGRSIEKLAEFAVQCWVESPGHHVNMIQSKWDQTGVGVYVRDTLTGPVICAVQIFVKSK